MKNFYYPVRYAALILLGLVIYGQTFGFGFVFDDLPFIVNNPSIRSFDHVHDIWKIFPQTRTIGFYSFAFNYSINQLDPRGYHIFNFVIHLVAVGLVWAIASRLFKMVGRVADGKQLAFFVAALFLVHPCQTQAVTYITQRFESLATVFYLGSIYFYLCGRISTSRGYKIFSFVLCVSSAILGIFTKEVAATIPLMILSLELIFFNGKYQQNLQKLLIIITVSGLFFFLLFMNLARTDLSIFFHFNPSPSQSHDGDIITLKNYLLTQMRVFLTFIRLLVFPIHQNLDYDYSVSTGLFDPPLTLVGMLLMGTAFFSIFKLRSKFPIIAFGLAWILITFSINLAPRQNVIFEHKLYLMSFGFFLVLVSTLSVFIRQKKLLTRTLVIIIAILSLFTMARNQVWRNEVTLWNDVVAKSPHKARPYNNRGSGYAHQGHFTQALSDYNKAIDINPNYVDAYYNRAYVYDKEGNSVQAIADYSKVVELNPNYVDAYNNRGDIYRRLGKSDQALSDFTQAIKIDPAYEDPYLNRGLIYAQRGDFTQAVSDYNEVIEIDPNNISAYVNRGTFLAQQKKFTQALIDYNKAIELAPGFPQAYFNRAVTYYQLKEYDNAWLDVNTAKGLGVDVNMHFINALERASGRGE